MSANNRAFFLRPRLAAAICGIALLLAGGCGKSMSPVSGLVTLDGKPLANARVILTPVDGKGRPAQGVTDDSGRFSITSIKPNDGALKGEYKVTFSLIEDDMLDLTKIKDDGSQDVRQRAAAAQDKARKAAEKKTGKRASLLHPNYTRVDKTPKTLTIPTSGDVTLALTAEGN